MPTSPFADRRGLFQELLTSGRGVDVTGFCRVHPGVPLEPAEYLRPAPPSTSAGTITTHHNNHTGPGYAPVVNGAVGVCHRCTAEREHADLVPQTELACVYCWEPMVGLYAPCLSCGCVTHEACLADWHAMGGAECPAGHDCCCVEEASSEAAGSWAGLRAAAAAAAAVLLAGENGNSSAGHSRGGSTMGPAGGESSSGGTGARSGAAARSARSRRKSAPADAAKFHILRRMTESPGAGAGSEGYGSTETAGVAARHHGSVRSAAGGGRRRGQDDSDIDRTDREGAAGAASSSSQGIPSVTITGVAAGLLAGVKPPPRGEEPISAAQLSLGKRLKKQLEESGRPGVPRRNSGGLAMWKSSNVGG